MMKAIFHQLYGLKQQHVLQEQPTLMKHLMLNLMNRIHNNKVVYRKSSMEILIKNFQQNVINRFHFLKTKEPFLLLCVKFK